MSIFNFCVSIEFIKTFSDYTICYGRHMWCIRNAQTSICAQKNERERVNDSESQTTRTCRILIDGNDVSA